MPIFTVNDLLEVTGAAIRTVTALLVVLMSLSEYRRTRRDTFRFVGWAFALMLVHQSVAGGVGLWQSDHPWLRLWLPAGLHLVEGCFLVLLNHAMAVHERARRTELRRLTRRVLLGNLLIAVVVEAFWLLHAGAEPGARFHDFWGEPFFAAWHLLLVGLGVYLGAVLKPEIRVLPALLVLAVGQAGRLADLLLWESSPMAVTLIQTGAGAVSACMLLAAAHFGIIAETFTDPLTRLHNRRYFMSRIPTEFARARRRGEPIAVLVLDLDHFKRYNDTHGHVAGDKLLRLTATLLNRHLRTQDTLCRWGGEEFIVILPSAGLEQAWRIAERLRQAIADSFGGPNRKAPVTISVGIAAYPEVAEDWRSLVEAADEALYEAKVWRNRVAVAGRVG